MPEAKKFTFICGADDYLVARAAQERFAAMSAEIQDEFAREMISGYSANAGEIAAAINRFREAVQTVSLFGGRRAVWLKDINFLADSPTGRAEGTLKLVEELQELLEGVNPADTSVLVSAAPIDRRRSFPKWCEKNADFMAAGGEGPESLAPAVLAEAQAQGAVFGPGAEELLLAKIGANSRLLIEETRKLAAYAAPRASDGLLVIGEEDVAEMTPDVAEGDFFAAADAFFGGNLPRTLEALRRHFFTGGDARPLISALQNRNRLLLQLRALLDAGRIRIGPRGVEGLSAAAATHSEAFGEAAGQKGPFNVFAQNPWYLGKLAAAGRLPPLKRLIDNQRQFLWAFEQIVARPREQEEVLRELAVRCLGG